jgi:hypothetical protein
MDSFFIELQSRNLFLKSRIAKLEAAIIEELQREEFRRNADGVCHYCGSVEHTETCRVGRIEESLLL